MLCIKCRKRLELAREFVPIDQVSSQLIRASAWEFGLFWEEPSDTPTSIKVDGVILYENSSPQSEVHPLLFVLPPTASDLTRLEIETASGGREVRILQVISGYQIPETHLESFYEYLQYLKQVSSDVSAQGDVLGMAWEKTTLSKSSSAPNPEETRDDVPKGIRQELAICFQRVLQAPNTRLVDESSLVKPSEVRRVMPDMINYFTRHPETWHKRGGLKPRPVKLLDRRTVEDYDVYENRFVLHFLESLEIRLRSIIQRNVTLVSELGVKQKEAQKWGWLESSLAENWREQLDWLEFQREDAQADLDDLRGFRDLIDKMRAHPLFTQVQPLDGAPRPNAVLRMHPIYGRLYQLYREIEQEEFGHRYQRLLDESRRSNLLDDFRGYCYLVALRALQECHFYLASTGMQELSVFRGNTSAASGSANTPDLHLCSELIGNGVSVRLKMIMQDQDAVLGGAILIEFKNEAAAGSAGCSQVYLIPDTTWWGEADQGVSADQKRQAIRQMYVAMSQFFQSVACNKNQDARRKRRSRRKEDEDMNVDQSLVSLISIHMTPPSNFDEALGYADLRLLINQGDNFVTREDYNLFGGYQVGCLPIYPPISSESLERSVSRVKRLIRIHLIRVGVDYICWNCFSKVESKDTGGRREFECLGCHLRWGEVTCSKCGGKFFKMKLPRDSLRIDTGLQLVDIQSDKEAVIVSEAIEGRLSAASPCESLDHVQDFWAICPFCGDCQKESKSANCRRCQAKS